MERYSYVPCSVASTAKITYIYIHVSAFYKWWYQVILITFFVLTHTKHMYTSVKILPVLYVFPCIYYVIANGVLQFTTDNKVSSYMYVLIEPFLN